MIRTAAGTAASWQSQLAQAVIIFSIFQATEVLKRGAAMSVNIQAYGKKFPVADFRQGEPVGELKAKFEAEYGVKAEHMELVAGGHTYLDEETARVNLFHLRLLPCKLSFDAYVLVILY